MPAIALRAPLAGPAARAGSALYLSLLYLACHGRWPDLAAPRRFTEWVQWRKLHDRRAALGRLTDKLHAKAIATAALGPDWLVPVLWQGSLLPRRPCWPMPFVVKANHGCGQFIVVRSDADWLRARLRSLVWMRGAYGTALGEWHYALAQPALLVEPFLATPDPLPLPLDYKIYVFGGRAAMIQLHEGRGGDHRWTQYNRDWRVLSRQKSDRPAPASLPAMIAAAERLARGHDFLRVDFYEVEGRPLFGEFCLFPGSGLDPFDPVGLDDWLGDLWSATARA